MSNVEYVIGIDLGTTNCTMASTRLSESENTFIEQFSVPQLSSAGTQKEIFSLPSFIYFPLAEELRAEIAGISWDPSRCFCVGTFARERGGELPSRLIASAKSWLCQSGVDRGETFLPVGSEEGVVKMSALDACSELLRHLREAWDNKMDAPFSEQQILVTVPASFDPSARQLVQEASTKAGYPEVILLEEPQAAFYAWLDLHAKDWRNLLKVGDTILVIDIGGGTTDFSLISVNDEGGDLTLQRLAVGAHLLLGGDNIDLSLAYLAKGKLEEQGYTIDDWQFRALVHSCRDAKETLMGESPPKHVEMPIMGRGSRLIGGSVKVRITLAEVRLLILNGFAPIVSIEERSKAEKRSGLQQVGLSYAQDARFTCQLAKFLSMTGEADHGGLENFVMPTVVLFNGGTAKAKALREQLVEQLNQWAIHLHKPPVTVLSDADYDYAVSRGAVSYGLARNGRSVRIKSGTSRSFYIGVEDAVLAVPGIAPSLKAICVAPYGMEEGSELQLDQQEFSLVIGEPVSFRFFSHATPKLGDGIVPVMGSIVRQWKNELTELHSIETCLDGSVSDGKIVRVKINSRFTELGVLEVWCVASDQRKWKLEFDIRKENDALSLHVKP